MPRTKSFVRCLRNQASVLTIYGLFVVAWKESVVRDAWYQLQFAA